MKKQILIGSLVLVSIFNCFAQQRNENILKKTLLVSNKIDDSKNSDILLSKGKGYYYSEKPNYALAFKYFKQAAELNNGEAKYMICLCYLNGQGVVKNTLQAAIWCDEATESYPKACYLYAKLIEDNLVNTTITLSDGKTVSKEREILIYMKMAADANVMEAHKWLGNYYEKRDSEMSRKYYLKAATLGDAESSYNMGIYYLCQYLNSNDSRDLSRSMLLFKNAEKFGYTLIKDFTSQNFKSNKEVKEWIQNNKIKKEY